MSGSPTLRPRMGNDTNSDLVERIFWFIRLRWIAVTGVILTILFTTRILKISLPARSPSTSAGHTYLFC